MESFKFGSRCAVSPPLSGVRGDRDAFWRPDLSRLCGKSVSHPAACVQEMRKRGGE